MTDIIINGGWVLAGLAVGLVCLVVMGIVVFGPMIGASWVFEEHIRYSKWWQNRERRVMLVGNVIGGAAIAALLLSFIALAGFATLNGSYENFGWPPIPEWMQDYFNASNKKEC